MTTLLGRLRATLAEEFDELQKILDPLDDHIKDLAEQDIKEIARAGLAAAVAVIAKEGRLTLAVLEAAIIAAGRAIIDTAKAKGLAALADLADGK